MKNRCKDGALMLNRCTLIEKYFQIAWMVNYFTRYITSFTSFTVRGTSGNAAATRLAA